MMKVCADPTVPPAEMAVGIREVSWNVTGRFRLSPTLNCWLTGYSETSCLSTRTGHLVLPARNLLRWVVLPHYAYSARLLLFA